MWLFSSLFTGGLTYFVLAFNESIYFAVTTEIIGGAAIAVFNIHNITVYQQIIPNHLIGKVISVRLLIIRAVMPLGIIFGGVMSEIFGIQPLYFIIGLFIMFSALLGIVLPYFHFMNRSLNKSDRMSTSSDKLS